MASATNAVLQGIALHQALMERDAATRRAERERIVGAVLALHRRRPHSVNGGTPSVGFLDFVAHGQTEFPDLCDHCRTSWPCMTARALEGV